jgi:hypothetical protein
MLRIFFIELAIPALEEIDGREIESRITVDILFPIVRPEAVHQGGAAIRRELAVENKACIAVAKFMEQRLHVGDRTHINAVADVTAGEFVPKPCVCDNKSLGAGFVAARDHFTEPR